MHKERNLQDHYKQRDRGIDSRDESRTKPLRNFNNWVKSVLISEHCKAGYTVLDLCCGKGGDLQKYATARIAFYVGVDIVKQSIHDAKKRYDDSKRKTFEAIFVEGDVCDDSVSISEVVNEHLAPLRLEYDLVSSQFSINYLTATEAKFRAFLRNVSENLKPGGYFIGTIPDANVLVKKLRVLGRSKEFGNDYYSVKFDADEFPRSGGCFGIKYGFYLQDCVGERLTRPEGEVIEYVPEYLVIPEAFAALAKEFQLIPEYRRNFHEFYREKIERHRDLFQSMMRNAGDLNTDLWDVAYLYDVIVLRKEGEFDPPPETRHETQSEARILQLHPDTTID